MTPRLVLGPVLRYVGRDEATVWVETDAPCRVEVLGREAHTFSVAGHHFALVHLSGLEPGVEHAYEVALDGARAWPGPAWDLPPSTIRVPDGQGPLRVVFGSCRVALPHARPHTLSPDRDAAGRGHDALRAMAQRMIRQPSREWPDALLLLGDQVYADEGSPSAREHFRSRRDTRRPPGEEAADFEEYTRLYRESWSDPVVRWLLSTVPSAMIFDDHEVHDDWNISETWVRQMRRKPWWHERLVGAYMSYWIYQHLGNLAPAELREDATWRAVRGAGDATATLRAVAEEWTRTTDGSRWSYRRDFGRVRLVMVDSRGGRLLGRGRRRMVDEEEWSWIVDNARGDVSHLLIASSLPLVLPEGMHHFEAWSEAVCDGAWGAPAAALCERLRQALDLEHWGAFGESFGRLTELMRAVGAGERGAAPASIVILSGDVHHAYLAEMGFPADAGVRSRIYQAVCSPFRNTLPARERRVVRLAASGPAARVGRLLLRAARVPRHPVRWRLTNAPLFENHFGRLELEGERARLTIECVTDEDGRPSLRPRVERRLA